MLKKKRKMADAISNIFSDVPSTSTSGMRTTPGLPASPQVNAPDT